MVSGLPIGEGDNVQVRFIALMRNPYSDSGACSVHYAWLPLHAGIKAVYNNYGSIKEIEESANTDSFFETLSKFCVEREVGENQYHDVAVEKGMSRERWLEALWENRVQVYEPKYQFPDMTTVMEAFKSGDTQTLTSSIETLGTITPREGSILDVTWTMIREDVWQLLLGLIPSTPEYVDSRNTLYPMDGWSPDKELQDEHVRVTRALHALSRVWAAGHTSGPQWAEWNPQVKFLHEIHNIAFWSAIKKPFFEETPVQKGDVSSFVGVVGPSIRGLANMVYRKTLETMEASSRVLLVLDHSLLPVLQTKVWPESTLNFLSQWCPTSANVKELQRRIEDTKAEWIFIANPLSLANPKKPWEVYSDLRYLAIQLKVHIEAVVIPDRSDRVDMLRFDHVVRLDKESGQS